MGDRGGSTTFFRIPGIILETKFRKGNSRTTFEKQMVSYLMYCYVSETSRDTFIKQDPLGGGVGALGVGVSGA